MNKYIIYTDGSCHWKCRKGGVGVYIVEPSEQEIFFQKGYDDTTVSRMELRAVIHALQLVEEKVGVHLTLHLDSEYTVNSINRGWVLNWEKEGWVFRKNADLWMKFLFELRRFHSQLSKVEFKWVKGHANIYGNEVADILSDYHFQSDFELDEEK